MLFIESNTINSLTVFSFLHLTQLCFLWSSTTSHGTVILLQFFLTHNWWYVNSKAFFLFSCISKLHFLHDFANPASLRGLRHYVLLALVDDHPDAVLIHVGTNDKLNQANHIDITNNNWNWEKWQSTWHQWYIVFISFCKEKSKI